MAGVSTEEPGVGRPSDEVSGEQLYQSGEALVEWRSSEQIESGTPTTSPPYWDISDEDDGGLKPSELYGKHTWKIDKFSQINKRELRSTAFEVGGYKWYILIYPQGCDVCNHLSLFLCVANHDKLLPGWSHFAQFTIAVVNKDPKKSKYSDTLHRFWKKEHDWGWKKFMELSKVMDGFIDADTLIIKAQVQVIRERADRPFRCLDCQYRRELVRVYLTNVEQICRRFVEERRGKLEKLIEDKARWSSFRSFWLSMDQSSKSRMSREKTESILKTVVKHFFIEKEVTSTLVMDSLYSGLKALEGQSKGKKTKLKNLEMEELPVPVIRIEKETLVLEDDVLLLLERAAMEPLPPKDDKGPQNRTKDGAAGEEFNKDSIERDERRLTDLGRRTIEIFVLAHIFSNIEVAYQEAVSLKRQEELIREEEEAWLADIEQRMKRGTVDKDKKSKKKQGKQKRNNRKGKDKIKEDKLDLNVPEKMEQDILDVERKEILNTETELVLDKPSTVEDNSDVSDSADCAPEFLPPDLKDRDADTFEVQPSAEASGSELLSGVPNGVDRVGPSTVEDNLATCGTDSVSSVFTSVIHNGNSRNHKTHKNSSSGRNHLRKVTSDRVDWINEECSQPTEVVPDARPSNDASRSSKTDESISKTPVSSSQDSASNPELHVGKEESHKHPSAGGVVAEASRDRIISPPRSPSISAPYAASPKLEPKSKAPNDSIAVKRYSSDNPKQSDIPARIANSTEMATSSKRDPQKFSKQIENPSGDQAVDASDKPAAQPLRVANEKPSVPHMPGMSRPGSVPIFPTPRPSVSVVSVVQTAPTLARSVSATGRLDPETTASNHTYTPHSYRNAIIGSNNAPPNSPGYIQNHSASSATTSHSYSQSPLFLPHSSSDRVGSIPVRPSFPYGVASQHDMRQNTRPMWVGSGDSMKIRNDMHRYELYESMRSRSQDHLSAEFPACTTVRQSHVLGEEFPHIDIINDLLLEDEHGIGAQKNLSYSSFSTMPHNLNRQFSFPGYPGMSSGLSQPSVERNQGYLDNGFQRGYGSYSGNPYESVRDIIPQTCVQPYVNGHMDNLMNHQWQMSSSDMLPYTNTRNTDDGGYSFHMPEFTNHTVGVNGYVFRPSNGP